jgi:hypothetical protein
LRRGRAGVVPELKVLGFTALMLLLLLLGTAAVSLLKG